MIHQEYITHVGFFMCYYGYVPGLHSFLFVYLLNMIIWCNWDWWENVIMFILHDIIKENVSPCANKFHWTSLIEIICFRSAGFNYRQDYELYQY